MAGNIIDQWFAAASVGDDYKTMHVWDGDGNASRVFEINFQGGYINQADVKAFMVNKTTQARTDLTVRFTGSNTVTLSQAVPVTHQVTIYRDTNKTAPLAAFADGAIITALNLDRNAKQAVFAVAEMVDRFDSVTATAQDAIATAYSALDKANTAISTANAATATANGAKTAAAGAVADAKAAVQTANTATSTANAAKATAEGIDAKVNQAVATSNAANTTAGQAKDTAEGIDAKATQAQSDAAKAKTDAATALSTANGIDSKATTALNNSATALTKAQQALDAVNASAGNFDKIWATVKGVSGNNISFKGDVNADGSIQGNNLYATNLIRVYNGKRLAFNAPDNNSEINLGSTGGSLVFNYNGAHTALDMNNLDLNNARSLGTTGNVNSITPDPVNPANGSYLNTSQLLAGWRSRGASNGTNRGYVSLYGQERVGYYWAGIITVGGYSSSPSFYFYQDGRFTAPGNIEAGSGVTAVGNVTGADLVARGTVFSGGGGNGRMAPDGNVYGTRWGGWAYDWIIANAMTDFGRGGQQYRGSARDAWESPAGCVLTGRANNVNDGRDQGIYFRQLVGRKINGGQFGVGDFG